MTLKQTPLFDQHVARGARMTEFGGWNMPVQYSGILAEHARVRTAAGLFDVSHMGEVALEGEDASAAVSWLVSNDVSSIDVGQAQYNVMCNESGGVVDDVVVYRRGEQSFMVCVNAANRQKDFDWMVKHNRFPQVTIENHSDAWGQVAIQGPKATQILQSLTALPLATIETYWFGEGAVAGVDGCIVARTGYTGEDGFEVFMPAEQAPSVWTALLQAGESDGILPIGLGARDTLRLEVRYCLYGHELTDETSPLQAGLGWVTKIGKEGGFVGEEALAARKGNESHRLVGLVMQGKRIGRENMTIHDADGQEVGWVTSGTRSPTLKKGVCLGYVSRTCMRPGTMLQVDVRGKRESAIVHKGPFYQRDAS